MLPFSTLIIFMLPMPMHPMKYEPLEMTLASNNDRRTAYDLSKTSRYGNEDHRFVELLRKVRPVDVGYHSFVDSTLQNFECSVAPYRATTTLRKGDGNEAREGVHYQHGWTEIRIQGLLLRLR